MEEMEPLGGGGKSLIAAEAEVEDPGLISFLDRRDGRYTQRTP